MSQFKKMAVHGMVWSVLISLSGMPVMAEQVIRDLDDSVTATLKTDIDSKTVQPGQPFEAQLDDEVRYKDLTLPAGTVFHGQVTKARHASLFSLPGYVVLEVEDATLPSGQTFAFSPDKYQPRGKKTHTKAARNLIGNTIDQAPYTAASLGTTIPLRTSDAIDGPTTIPIGLGVRMALGAGIGLFRNSGYYANKPAAYKFVRGALDGSGIPRIVGFVTGKSDAPQLLAGEPVNLYFNEQGLSDLLQAAQGDSAMRPEAQPQPSAAMPATE